MNSDQAFSEYALSMTKWLCAMAVVGAAVCFFFWGWTAGAGFALGAVFHAAFYMVLLWRYRKWILEGREPVYIGRRLAGYAALRFVLEIVICVVAVIYTPLNIFALLGGLLTLPVVTLLDRAGSAVKS